MVASYYAAWIWNIEEREINGAELQVALTTLGAVQSGVMSPLSRQGRSLAGAALQVRVPRMHNSKVQG